MRPVFGFGVAGDQDVVDVDESEIQASEDLVHEPLERLCRILKAERHAEELPQTERGDDGRLGDVVCVHWDLVVATNQINLREEGTSQCRHVYTRSRYAIGMQSLT